MLKPPRRGYGRLPVNLLRGFMVNFSKRKFFASGFILPLLFGCEPEVKEVVKYVEVEKVVTQEVAAETGDTGTSGTSGTSGNSGNSGSAASTDIFLVGSLAISAEPATSTLTSFSLNADSYSLNCVTFAENPQSFSIAVALDDDGNYSFNDTLTDTAGQSFGCFLLKNQQMLSPIVFGSESSLVAGAGKIEVDLTYNESTGSAQATIDETASTALDPEKVAAAMEAAGSTTTDLSTFGGTYKFTCDTTEDGLPCDASEIPSQAYFSQFSVGTNKKVAIWESAEKRNQCVPTGYTEASPNFNMKIGSTSLEMDFRDVDSLNASLDAAFETLYIQSASTPQKEIADILLASVTQYTEYKESQCTLLSSAANCKYVLGDVETYSYVDAMTNETVTYSYPKWYSEMEFASLIDYTGDVTAKFQKCTTHWSPDSDICPPDAIMGENGNGTYKTYFGRDASGTEKRIRLICQASDSWHNFQEWAPANTKADSLTTLTSQSGCAVISNGSSLNGQKEYVRNDLRNRISEIAAMSMYRDGDNLCKNYGVPTGFKFSDCNSSAIQQDLTQLNYTYWEAEKPSWIDSYMEEQAANDGVEWISYFSKDWGAAELCRQLSWNLDYWNMSIDNTSGKIVETDTLDTTSGPWEWGGRHLCPTYYSSYDYSTVIFGTTALAQTN